jgi:hypothetical protein
MTGFNLPPGCATGHLPGNSSEEMQRERAAEARYCDLIDSELAWELSEQEARELLEGVISALHAPRINDTETLREHAERTREAAVAKIDRAVSRIINQMED